MPHIGTRSRSTAPNNYSTLSVNQSLNRDPGLSKLATGSFTFSASSGQVSGANGSFPAFLVDDVVIVLDANLNNGTFVVTAIDTTNQSYLTLDPTPKNETVTCTVRTQ